MTETLNTTTVGWIVALSILDSIVASYAAFSFAEHVAEARGRAHALWLAAGAASLGLGVWSMHYLGMLAVHLPIDVTYHVPTVLASLIFAFIASIIALEVVSADRLGPVRHMLGSVLMGSGIGAMHYTGMHAMRCAAMHRYDMSIVALSVVIAVAFSYAALEIAFTIRRTPEMKEALRIGGAAVMGVGIAAMHYTAMTAVTFERSSLPVSLRHTVRISTIGSVGLAITISIVLFGTLGSTIFDRRIHRQMQTLLDQIAEERDRFYATAESSMDALYICTACHGLRGEVEDFILQYLNSNAEKMVALERDQMVGRRLSSILPVMRLLGLMDVYKQVVITGVPLVHELQLNEPQVHELALCEPQIDAPHLKRSKMLNGWLRIQAVKVRDGVAITVSDITTRKENERQILHLAHHDPLTGLLNRSLLQDRIQQAMEYARRYRIGMGVFLIDLDGFKQINDTLGHAAGDLLLVTVAQRLRMLVRECDSVIRIGGDEFVVVISDLNHASDAGRFAQKLAAALLPPIKMEGKPISVTCSIGVALFPGAAIEPRELLRMADLAMYAAKQRGKNRFQIAEAEAIAS